MDEMNKHQFVLLVLLVSFVTALVTGIVTASLIGENPPRIIQTIQKVVEKVIETPTKVQDLLPKDEKKELELSALARDVLIEDIVSRALPVVVTVIATKDIPVLEQIFVSPFDESDPLSRLFPELKIPQLRQKGVEKQQVSSGSGFFVASDGTVLTNKHVVDDPDAEYTVILNNGKKLNAKVLARDPLHDAAVLKVEDSGNFSALPLGDSENLRAGRTVIVIGSPLEFQNTVSAGIISGLRRTITASGGRSGPEEIFEAIQTDAAINPGNSGGPMLNLKGEVVGLSTAVAIGAENIGFAIPVNQVKRAIKDAREKGKIVYPYLGVRYTLVTPEVKEKHKLLVDYGAIVLKGAQGEPAVLQGSPASKAGLQEGDVLLEFGGVKITQNNSLAKLIQQKSAGDKVTIKFLRGGPALPDGSRGWKETSVEVTLEERKNF